MSRFKVGDRVHYVGTYYKVKGEGVVVRVYDLRSTRWAYPYDVRFEGFNYAGAWADASFDSHACAEEELELMK